MSYEYEISDGLRDRHQRESVSFEARLPEILREAFADGEIEKCPIVIRWEICDICGGDGGHSRRFGTMVGTELQDLDEGIWQAYARGDLDEPCHECKATGKLQSLDQEVLSLEAKQYIRTLRDDMADRHAEEWAERFC
jgi:hypothetical protein